MTVVNLHDKTEIHQPGSPDPEVIEYIRGLLKLAEDGQVIGIACSLEHHDGANNNRYVGMISRKLLGGLHMVAWRMTKELNDV